MVTRDKSALNVAAAIHTHLGRMGGFRLSKIIGLVHTKRAVQFVARAGVWRYRVTITRELNE